MIKNYEKIGNNLRSSQKFREFIRFCIIGIVATLLHYSTYYIIIKSFHIEKEIWLNGAYTIGYVISWCCNLYLTAHYTFRTNINIKRGVGFAVSHGINYLLHLVFLNLFLWMRISATIAPWLVFCCVVPINFILVRIVFKKL